MNHCDKHGYSIRICSKGLLNYNFCPRCRIDELEDERDKMITRITALEAKNKAGVEKIHTAFKVAFETLSHVDISVDRDKRWFFNHPTLIEALDALGLEIKRFREQE